MTDEQMIIAFIAATVIVAIWVAVVNKKREKENAERMLGTKYGKAFSNEHEHEHLVNLHEILKYSDTDISDEIWHDLTMDRVFACLDTSVSAIGEEYLYTALHKLEQNEEVLKNRSRLAEELKDEKYSFGYRKSLSQIKKQRRFTVYQFIETMLTASSNNSLLHIVMLLAFLASIGLIFVLPAVGVPMLLIVACINSISYFFAKSRIAGYNYSIEVIVRWLAAVRGFSISDIDKIKTPVLYKRISDIKSLGDKFGGIRKISWMFAPSNAVSSILDVVLEYLKFFTHMDIIGFNYIVKYLSKHREDLKQLYTETGELELGIIIAQIRTFGLPVCEPDFADGEICVYAKNMVHPLVKDPVPNDVELTGNGLITGSNASGKSTFLKMIALNLLLSETLYTAFAKEFKSGRMAICTSFDISDDIVGGDSFYIAEIKRLKKIMDFSVGNSGTLICIDEILKGTNTRERIAASTNILKYLGKSRSLVLAATHDVELTDLLEGDYENYYFTEDPDNEKIFDYKLHKGKNYKGNAIRLLKLYGFPDEVIDESRRMVEVSGKF